ncbi:SBP (S-ribonuclease binding protein) family protein [Abeliophyllum distichum]|uniref:SBP (S-ribonuclease binding protein) family protein n=1 Tax=Abeliophyllum distichum TaxID=126358 RepID=A0ABD1P472_9LAMI
MELGSRNFFLCPKRAEATPESCSAAVTMAHYQALPEEVTGSVVQRLREKETDVQKAVKRNNEQEAQEAQLNSEVQTCQERAREQETTVTVLRSQLLRARIG